MIKVSRLDGREFVINAELIEMIEANPDTVLSLTTGHKFVVRDSVDELIERVIAYRQRIARPRSHLQVLALPTAD